MLVLKASLKSKFSVLTVLTAKNHYGCYILPAKPTDSSSNSKNTKKHSRKIRVCPFCKQPTLRVADSISGWMTAEIFKCDRCGYRGPVFIEVDPKELERIRQTPQVAEEDENEE